MFVVSSGFIAVFKTGDNINYNLRILRVLNAQFAGAGAEEKRLLCKPITILLISIIEAALHDFHYRCSQYKWERVANLADDVISYMRGKKISKLSQYIHSAEKHDLFGAAGSALYGELDLLNKLRNRLHIQNENKDLEPDELIRARALHRSVSVIVSKQ